MEIESYEQKRKRLQDARDARRVHHDAFVRSGSTCTCESWCAFGKGKPITDVGQVCLCGCHHDALVVATWGAWTHGHSPRSVHGPGCPSEANRCLTLGELDFLYAGELLDVLDEPQVRS